MAAHNIRLHTAPVGLQNWVHSRSMIKPPPCLASMQWVHTWWSLLRILCYPVRITHSGNICSVTAVITVTGATGKFMDCTLAEKCFQFPSVCIASMTIERPETQSHVIIPPDYHEFRDVFSKVKASELPPHRSYTYTIDLLAGATPPHNYIYPLAGKKTQAMNEYI